MQIAIKERKLHDSNVCVFNTATDCSFFLNEKPDYVSRLVKHFFKKNGTLKGLDLISKKGNVYGIVAYVSPSINYHPNFNFWNSDYYTYGNCVIIRNVVTNQTYGFKSNATCCEFLGRHKNFLNDFQRKSTILKSYVDKETYQILQFKLQGRAGSVFQTRKECERFSSKLRMHKKDNRQEIAMLLKKINNKYDNLVDACQDNAPEFLELQRLETSYEFDFFEW